MKKIYKTLTKDQKARGVIFASTLSYNTTETEGDKTHEVFALNTNSVSNDNKIENLLNDSFFNSCNLYRYNIIRK